MDNKTRIDILAPLGKRLAIYLENPSTSVLILPNERKIIVSPTLQLIEILKKIKEGEELEVSIMGKVFFTHVEELRKTLISPSIFLLSIPKGYRIERFKKPAIAVKQKKPSHSNSQGPPLPSL